MALLYFTRGETQSLTTVTLGSATDVNRIDGVTEQGSERFIYTTTFLHFQLRSSSQLEEHQDERLDMVIAQEL